MGATTTLEGIDGVVRDGYPREIAKSTVNRVLTAWSLQRPALRSSVGLFQGAPELAVEIVFAELATSLESEIELYFAHGSSSVWVVYPQRRIVRIYYSGGGAKRFEHDQPLVDPAVLPGFSVPASAIFEGV